MADKVVMNLATGVEDAARARQRRVSRRRRGGGAGQQVAMSETEEVVRLAPSGYAEAVACDGCPIRFSARKLDEAQLTGDARLAGATPLWQWIGDQATVLS